MKSKAKSVGVYTLRLWSLKHFKNKKTTQQDNIYQGHIIDCKSKKKIFFHTPSQFLAVIEKLQKREG